MKTLIHSIKTLYTPCLKPPVKGPDMAKIRTLDNAWILIEDDKIAAVGSGGIVPSSDRSYDAMGAIAVPGFVDSHTHIVHAGSREHEFAKKVAGVPYLEILKQGGGILSTVAKTREASFQDLFDQAYRSLDLMLSYGVTTIEAKSGYGLDVSTERTMLEVMKSLDDAHPIDLSITYMGAHALPSEFRNNRDAYVDLVVDEIAFVAKRRLAESVDVFAEDGAFTIAEAKRILEAAAKHRLKGRIHADEIVPMGGGTLAAECRAASADHLMASSKEDIALLAKTDTILNLLPGTSFYLNKEYADARGMIAANAALAVSSDYNPGSQPSENFQFILSLCAGKLKMTKEEILTACTINAAFHLGRADKIGSIEVGKQADLVLLNAPNFEYVLYHYGINHTKAVFKNGRLVYEQKARPPYDTM
jgi:imidazolonepropionase